MPPPSSRIPGNHRSHHVIKKVTLIHLVKRGSSSQVFSYEENGTAANLQVKSVAMSLPPLPRHEPLHYYLLSSCVGGCTRTKHQPSRKELTRTMCEIRVRPRTRVSRCVSAPLTTSNSKYRTTEFPQFCEPGQLSATHLVGMGTTSWVLGTRHSKLLVN